MPGMHFRPSPRMPYTHFGPVHLRGLTEEEYKAFIKDNPDGLESLPKNARTADMCRYAMECKGYTDIKAWINDCWENFKYLPEELFTEENCSVFLDSGFKDERKTEYTSGRRDTLSYKNIDDYYKWIIRWESLRNKALEIDPAFLRAIPKRELTQEYCDIAFKTCHEMIKFIPDKLKTAEMCYTAVKNVGSRIQYVPNEFINDDMCEVLISCGYLEYVPQDKLTDKTRAHYEAVRAEAEAQKKAKMEAELARRKAEQENARAAFIKYEEERKAKLMESAPTEHEFYKSLLIDKWGDTDDDSNTRRTIDTKTPSASTGSVFDDDFFAKIKKSLLELDEDTLTDLVKELASANNPENNIKYYSAVTTGIGEFIRLYEEGKFFIGDCIYMEEMLKDARNILPYAQEKKSSIKALHIDLNLVRSFGRGFSGRLAYLGMVSSGLAVEQYNESKGYKCYIGTDGNLVETRYSKPALICRENNCNLVVISPEEDKGVGFDYNENEVKGIVSAFHEIHPDCRIMVLSSWNNYQELKDGEQIRSYKAFQNELSAIIR